MYDALYLSYIIYILLLNGWFWLKFQALLKTSTNVSSDLISIALILIDLKKTQINFGSSSYTLYIKTSNQIYGGFLPDI